MRYSFVAFILPTVVSGHATPTRRDFPPLAVTLPAGQTLGQFSNLYTEACALWQPAIDDGFTFDFASAGETFPVAVPGEAEVQCQWDAVNGTEINFAQAVAESLGAYPVSS